MKVAVRIVGISLLFLLFLSISIVSAAYSLTIETDKSIVLNVDHVVKVAVANPQIADVVVVSKNQIVVIGKKNGVTSLQIWSGSGLKIYDVLVQDTAAALTQVLRQTFGFTRITAIKQDKTVILEGVVENQDQKIRAEQIAAAYGDKVVNLLEIAHNSQVKIEAKVVEISRNKLKRLGIDWGNEVTAPGGLKFGQSSANSVNSQSNKLGWLGTYSDINGKINALVQNGSATVLSQPNVITTSGSKANIMIGGEIPVPMSVNNGQVSVEWKSYGIKLYIEPQVSAQGIITSKIKAEVSSLDFQNTNATVKISDNYVIPALRVDQAETVISLASGQPMIIGGLLSTNVSTSENKVPFLGDLPLIGQLFKSVSSTTDQKEIIILITPTLITDNNYQAALSDSMRDALEGNQGGERNGGATNQRHDRK
jgi:pilus assembly protein CpaC